MSATLERISPSPKAIRPRPPHGSHTQQRTDRAPAPPSIDVVAKRQAALCALDPLVRPRLARLPAFPGAAVLPLTVYDAVYPATPEIGGHWTVCAVRIGPFAHTTLTYTVAVAFDAAAAPAYFVIAGAREITTRDASIAALDEGLALARASGPLHITTQHAFLVPGL